MKLREPIGIWWRISNYRPEIESLRVVAFTGSFVTYLEKEWRLQDDGAMRERRERRDDIFPTFEEAKAEMVRRVNVKIKAVQDELQRNRTFLGQAQSLKPPQEPA